MIYKIVGTGSKGNCVIYNQKIMVDCGVSFKAISEYIKDVEILFLTHKHKDHINVSAIRRMLKLKPNIRVACCEYLLPELEGIEIQNLDVLVAGKGYDYGLFKVSLFELYHDVDNVGFRFRTEKETWVHATDTYTLDGIEAKGFDFYFIEQNYDEELIENDLESEDKQTRFRARININSHLSIQQAKAFFEENRHNNSKLIPLHESSKFGYGY